MSFDTWLSIGVFGPFGLLVLVFAVSRCIPAWRRAWPWRDW